MAPDLNSLKSKVDYSTPGSEGYTVPDTVYRDPSARPLRVITIGAGVSGILNAYTIQKAFLQTEVPHNPANGPAPSPGVEHVVYDKNPDIGGTWLENRYPGCACDIPSHAYTYNFALNPDWPAFFSYSKDIWAYLDRVCEVFGLRKYMKFNTEVVGCHWDDENGEWKVKLRRWNDGVAEDFEDRCHLLLHATGVLNNFKWPDIPGLKDKFKGRVMHTARWDSSYKEEDWKKDSIAVIGSGASSIQTVPTMQKHAKHIDVFVRTPIWFVEIAGNQGQNYAYEEQQRQKFREDPSSLVAEAKKMEDRVLAGWPLFYADTEAQAMAQEVCSKRMGEFIKDKRLLDKMTPKWSVGCRRVTPGDPYMMAIQEENVDVHFTAVASCTEDGIVGADGVERKVDTIVCATGFDVSFRPRFPIVGKGGVDLRDKWAICPEGYLGLGSPDMPNFMTFVGPAWPIENGSVMGPLGSVSAYAVQAIRKMQQDHIKSWVPRQDITDQFNAHVQEWIKHSVWKDDCRSWYKNNETGKVNAIWPGSSLHYMQAIQHPRWEDFHIEYQHKNPWASLGMGFTIENKATVAYSDTTPYMGTDLLDPKWVEANKIQRASDSDQQDKRPSMVAKTDGW